MTNELSKVGDGETANLDPTGQSENNSSGIQALAKIKVDGYRLLSEIGRGGCGAVYEAIQTKTNRLVAIKILLGQTLSDRVRFDRETKALGKLKDPRIVDVYEAGICNAGPYFCMEYMAGGSLSRRLKSIKKMEAIQSAELIRTIAEGLEIVHRAGIIHRDLKPGNILLTPEGLPKIADFGLAKTYEANLNETLDQRISSTGGIIGTPSFMAPEQAERRTADVDIRTDVYALGVILFQCLTGELPFVEQNTYRMFDRIINERPVEPSKYHPGLSKSLEAICLKCLEKDPAKRYQTAQALADDLGAWLRGDETIARPATRIQRIARWCYRRRRIVAICASVFAIAISINLVAYWIKDNKYVPMAENDFPAEEKELSSILKEIESGKEVVLVGPTGKPRYLTKDQPPILFQNSRYADDPCTIYTTIESKCELLAEKDLPEEFRFQADVRHEFAENANARVGVFFGKFESNGENNSKLVYFNRMVFNDYMSLLVGTHENRIQFHPACIKMIPGESPDFRHGSLALRTIVEPPDFGTRPWRHIDITIRKDGVLIANLPGEPAIEPYPFIPHKDIGLCLESCSDQQKIDSELKKRMDTMILRGSIGLYNMKSIASFKNVTIQKLISK